MKRKRNIYFGFGPAKKSERLTVYRKPAAYRTKSGRYREKAGRIGTKTAKTGGERSDLASALANLGYDKAQARKMAQAARGSDFDSQLRDALKRNPRELPGVTTEQLAAFRRLTKGKAAMAKKRKSKKKRNGRKGTMPAGLKAYWAKKRRAKAKRRNPRRKRRNPRTRTRTRVRTRTVVKYRYRTRPRRKATRRRKANPKRRTSIRIQAPAGLGPKGLRKFRALAAKAYGCPARIVSR